MVYLLLHLVKVQFDTELWDTDSDYDNSTKWLQIYTFRSTKIIVHAQQKNQYTAASFSNAQIKQ